MLIRTLSRPIVEERTALFIFAGVNLLYHERGTKTDFRVV